jgi:hypothetical protein
VERHKGPTTGHKRPVIKTYYWGIRDPLCRYEDPCLRLSTGMNVYTYVYITIEAGETCYNWHIKIPSSFLLTLDSLAGYYSFGFCCLFCWLWTHLLATKALFFFAVWFADFGRACWLLLLKRKMRHTVSGMPETRGGWGGLLQRLVGAIAKALQGL